MDAQTYVDTAVDSAWVYKPVDVPTKKLRYG